MLQTLPGYLHYLSHCVVWLENLHCLYRDRISVIGGILQETTVVTDLKCLSVKRGRGFILLLYIREKNCWHAQELPNVAVIINPNDLSTGSFSFYNTGWNSCSSVTGSFWLILVSRRKLTNFICRSSVLSSMSASIDNANSKNSCFVILNSWYRPSSSSVGERVGGMFWNTLRIKCPEISGVGS
jgi:hypothetical protein